MGRLKRTPLRCSVFSIEIRPLLGLIAEMGAGKSYAAESYVLNGGGNQF